MSLLFFFLLFSAEGLVTERVVSLVPSVTEIIYAIGAQDKLVGVVKPCDWPPGIDKPIVGSFSSPNFETIYGLCPDIVFVEDTEQKRLWSKLNKLGLNIKVIAPKNIGEIYQAILEIGEILGKKENADSLVNKMKKTLAQFEVDPTKGTKTKVFIEISELPLMTCGRKSFITGLIGIAGGMNIFEDIEKAYPVINQELVIKRNPEVIIILHRNFTNPEKRMGWENISAIKHKQVYTNIDINLLVRPGPRVVKGVEELHKRIYGYRNRFRD